MAWGREGTARKEMDQVSALWYAHPVASSDGSDVLRGQNLPPGITIVRVKKMIPNK